MTKQEHDRVQRTCLALTNLIKKQNDGLYNIIMAFGTIDMAELSDKNRMIVKTVIKAATEIYDINGKELALIDIPFGKETTH